MILPTQFRPLWASIHRRSLQPLSKNQDSRRREFILNILLCGLTIISLIALAASLAEHFLFDTYDDGILGLVLVTVFTTFIIGLWYLSRRGWYQIGGYVLVALIWLTATILAIQWSIELPEAEIVYTLAIVIAAVVLSSRAGLIIASLTTAVIIAISYGQTHNLMHPSLAWTHDLSHFDDVIGFVVVFGIIGLISWLSNRETDLSLRRARASEAALTAERDNLETAVRERTRRLEQTQAERIMELQRFAEFGRLTSGLLHDLANPITTASLNLELIDKRERSHLVREAKENVRHLERYIEAARKQLQRESQLRWFETKTELAQATIILARRAKAANVTVQLPRLQHQLHGDPVKFNQLATNLITNAIDSYAHGTTPHAEAVVRVETEQTDDGIILTVTDWGSGIKGADLSQIFQPFYTTKDHHGTGLGLAMVKTIVETDFLGQISVTSTAETGTQFIAHLHNNRGRP